MVSANIFSYTRQPFWTYAIIFHGSLFWHRICACQSDDSIPKTSSVQRNNHLCSSLKSSTKTLIAMGRYDARSGCVKKKPVTCLHAIHVKSNPPLTHPTTRARCDETRASAKARGTARARTPFPRPPAPEARCRTQAARPRTACRRGSARRWRRSRPGPGPTASGIHRSSGRRRCSRR